MKKKRSWVVFFATVVFVGLCLTGSQVHASPVSPQLEAVLGSLPPDEEIPVIVTLREKPDLRGLKSELTGISRRPQRQKLIEMLKGLADSSQTLLKALLETRKAKNVRSLWIINGIAFSIPAYMVQEIAGQPEVERVSLDSTVSVPPVMPAAATVSEWNIDAIRAPVLWNSGYTGQGVVVANMDTGVDVLHPDLASSWRGGTNSWFDPNGQHLTPSDLNGHGTGTMGVIVGGSAGGTNIGVAPGAQWIAVKIFNDNDVATLSVIHQGFQWLLDPDENPSTDDAPDIINNSWGLDGSLNRCVTEFEADVQALRTAGIAVVFSGGNSGPYQSSSISPANYPERFAVGAVDETLNIASFSSRGPSACDSTIYPEVVAPGVNIKTADLTFDGVFPNSYVHVNGTSFSAPHVAGTMALLMSAFPNITLSQLEEVLKTTALDLGPKGPDNAYGYGLVDALASFVALGAIPSETLSVPTTPMGPAKAKAGTAYLFSIGGAVSSLGDQVEYFFDWGDETDSGWLTSGITNTSKSWISPGTYAIKARARCAIHPLVVSAWSGPLTVTVSVPITITVTSNGTYDGWIEESAQGTGIGGFVHGGRIKVGDDGTDQQRRGILSFNTSKVSVDAEILSATLKLTRKDVIEINPFTSLGTLFVDVMKGKFNQKRLQKADFEVQATAPQAAVMSDPEVTSGISTGILNVDGVNAINKGSITQMRLYFAQPTNGDGIADFITFHSGEAYSRKKRPTLEIFYLP